MRRSVVSIHSIALVSTTTTSMLDYLIAQHLLSIHMYHDLVLVCLPKVMLFVLLLTTNR